MSWGPREEGRDPAVLTGNDHTSLPRRSHATRPNFLRVRSSAALCRPHRMRRPPFRGTSERSTGAMRGDVRCRPRPRTSRTRSSLRHSRTRACRRSGPPRSPTAQTPRAGEGTGAGRVATDHRAGPPHRGRRPDARAATQLRGGTDCDHDTTRAGRPGGRPQRRTRRQPDPDTRDRSDRAGLPT